MLSALAGTAFDRLKAALGRLAQQPPQVMLFEGGSEVQRLAMARYWASCCNCPQSPAPCLVCQTCRQIATGEYLDILAYDGRISNREDEENPGLVRAFSMEQVRELKSRLRDVPHGSGRRVVMLMGLGQNRDEAANALLKVLEEPSPSTLFCLLAPQREQLLPTLVSRSFCLTLPWPDHHVTDPALAPWEESLATFLRQGSGLLDKTSAKGAVDATLAGQILLSCQKALGRLLAGESAGESDVLAAALSRLDAQGRAACVRWLDEAQEMVRYGVTPARVLEALAMRLFVSCRSAGQ